MRADLNSLLNTIEANEIIAPEDVLSLRRIVFDDNKISIVEADKIFALNDVISQKCAEWSEFFMEAMTDFVVRQNLPFGYVDETKAAWLIQRISKDGIVETLTELKALVNILKTAKDSPDQLVAFALEQIKAAVLHGDGVIGRGRSLELGKIGAGEVALLKDVLYACGGDNHIGITRNEAEVLFDLNDACSDQDNDDSWTDLFVKGITNYLMFLTSYETPDRAEILRREQWLHSDSSMNFGSLKFKDIGAEIFGFFKGSSPEDTQLSEDEAEYRADVNAAEAIDAQEAKWLVSRIGTDGRFDKNEKALMAYLEQESPYLHVSLQNLLDQTRNAA